LLNDLLKDFKTTSQICHRKLGKSVIFGAPKTGKSVISWYRFNEGKVILLYIAGEISSNIKAYLRSGND
jgi:hypothetical protein